VVTGVLGLAASLALQDVLKNFVAGVYLLVERPFRIGESIKVKDFTGAVETIDVRTTVLRTAEGDAVMVPNAILFAEIILNRGIPPPAAASADQADEPEPV
jgi:small-conductance mechanosensitive channel